MLSFVHTRRVLIVVPLAAVLSAAPGCGERLARADVDPPAATAADAPTVERGRFENVIPLTGELMAVRAQEILVPKTSVWSTTIRWIADDGSVVAKDERVLELDNSQFTGDLEQNRLSAAKALNDLMRKEADITVDLTEKRLALERARIEWEKARIRADIPPELIERREYQDRQLQLARAEVAREKGERELETASGAADAELEELRIQLETAQDKVREAEAAIEKLILYAPGDGMLVVAQNSGEKRKYQIGDTVWVGRPVLSIPDLTEMMVEAWLSDVDDGKIEVGMTASCTLDTYPDLSYTGRVTGITPIAKEQGNDSMRRAFRVEVLIDEADPERMRPGMSVRVEVLRDLRDDVLLVPRAAVRFDADETRVSLDDGSTRAVRLGPCDPVRCVVEEGLSEGLLVRAAG